MRVVSCSFSSDKKLARCEQQFFYRYGEGLKPKIKKLGLYRGDWMHQLLEAHYRKQDWEKKYKELKVKLWDKLFDEEKEHYGETIPDEMYELMGHYVEHWEPWDKKWKILHVEVRFSVDTKFGFPVRWQVDLLVEEKNRLVLVESKAKKAIPDSSERILQPQVHGYAYLLSRLNIKVSSILWNYIRTEPVPRPKINKDGSLSKRQISTDKRGYLKSLQEAGLHPESDEVFGVENKISELPETLSLERVTNSVNLKVGEMFVRQWIERHKRAQQIVKPLLNYNRNCKFDCEYYDLCQADILGQVDRKLIIKKDFVQHIKEVEELK